MPIIATQSAPPTMAEPGAMELRRNSRAPLSWHRLGCHLESLNGFLLPRFVTSLLLLGSALALGMLLLS
jgi:hypothetical protein